MTMLITSLHEHLPPSIARPKNYFEDPLGGKKSPRIGNYVKENKSVFFSVLQANEHECIHEASTNR